MKRIPLYAMAHARSGDKGDGSNVGVLAYDRRGYEILRAALTPERVKAQCEKEGMASICGFREISACTCVEGQCRDAGGPGGGGEVR